VHHAQGRDRIEYPIGHVLYQSNGWIGDLRFSPQGDKIAFMDHPAESDDRGSVSLIDLSGHVKVLTAEWESEDGLAWSPDGKEVWFTGVEKGINRDLLAVNMSGRIRKMLDLPAGLTLEDVAPDGRVLVSQDDERIAMATTARDGKSVDLSWHDWNIAKDISSDGQSVLFEDSSEAAGSHYSVAIGKIDGTPPVRLGEGSAGGLSPDGKWAISILTGSAERVTLLPIGPGQLRTISLPGLEHIQNGYSHFLADGKHITLNASEPGHGARSYLVDLDGENQYRSRRKGLRVGWFRPTDNTFSGPTMPQHQSRFILSLGAHPIPSLISNQIFLPSNGRRTTRQSMGFVAARCQPRCTSSTW
jgi:eukaryotic-like serine/threonine-protein kinase